MPERRPISSAAAPAADPCTTHQAKKIKQVTGCESTCKQSLNHAEHESLCSRCGKCCYKKIWVGQTVFVTPFPCEFLDTDTNTCTVYDRRHEVNPECLNMEDGFKHSAFPADCGYVPVMAPADYRPAVDTWSWDGDWLDFDRLADQLGVSDETREKVRARGPWAPPLWLEAMERLERERQAALAIAAETTDAASQATETIDAHGHATGLRVHAKFNSPAKSASSNEPHETKCIRSESEELS